MNSYIVQTCWNQFEKYVGISEYYKLIEDLCCDIRGIELYGLFRPLIDDWQWTFFSGVDSLDKWEELIEGLEGQNGQITKSSNRIFLLNSFNPKPRNIEDLNYLEIELSIWDGINIGVKNYYDSLVRVFNNKEGAWYMGLYQPANEEFNWANFFWYKSLNYLSFMDIESYKVTGRPENMKLGLERLYKKYL